MPVRLLTETDFEVWLSMRQALWPDISREEHIKEMESVASSPGWAVFLALDQGQQPAGFLEVSLREVVEGCKTSPVGYIEGWYVTAGARRQGLGSELIRAAEDWSRAQRAREIASDCLIDNQVSYTAHLALGYKEVERLIHFKKSL